MLAGERANCLSLVRVLCGPTRRADGDIGVGRIGLSSYLQYANYLFPFLVRSRDLAPEVTALWACSPHFPATHPQRISPSFAGGIRGSSAGSYPQSAAKP